MQIETILIENLKDSPYQGRMIGERSEVGQPVKKRLKELANSINSSGLLQAISVRKVDDKYEIIDGHRRVEAHKLLGIKTIQAVLTDKTDREVQVMSVVANLQRTNLNNIEKAIAFRKILKARIFKTKKELSKAIGKDETYVGDILKLLNLDKRIINDILKNQTTNDVRLLRLIRLSGELDEGGKSDAQFFVYQKFKKENLTRQELMALVSSGDKKIIRPVSVSGRNKKFRLSIQEEFTKEQQQKFMDIMEGKTQEAIEEVKATAGKRL